MLWLPKRYKEHARVICFSPRHDLTLPEMSERRDSSGCECVGATDKQPIWVSNISGYRYLRTRVKSWGVLIPTLMDKYGQATGCRMK